MENGVSKIRILLCAKNTKWIFRVFKVLRLVTRASFDPFLQRKGRVAIRSPPLRENSDGSLSGPLITLVHQKEDGFWFGADLSSVALAAYQKRAKSL